MEMMKRLLRAKGLPQPVMFHDVRWGAEHRDRFVWVLLNSGSSSAYAFNHDLDSLEGAHSYRQPAQYFPNPGGTMTGESLPGEITWSRAWIRADGRLVMDIGRGEVVKLPEATRDAWWEGTTRQWPFMATDMGITQQTLMAHYMSNHAAVAYGDIRDEMIALSRTLGFEVRVLGS
jgi:L-fucose isomerase-like protein